MFFFLRKYYNFALACAGKHTNGRTKTAAPTAKRRCGILALGMLAMFRMVWNGICSAVAVLLLRSQQQSSSADSQPVEFSAVNTSTYGYGIRRLQHGPQAVYYVYEPRAAAWQTLIFSMSVTRQI